MLKISVFLLILFQQVDKVVMSIKAKRLSTLVTIVTIANIVASSFKQRTSQVPPIEHLINYAGTFNDHMAVPTVVLNPDVLIPDGNEDDDATVEDIL